MKTSRRSFIKNTMAASAAVTFGGILPGVTAKSYASIIGANEKILAAVMGVNARGLALATNFCRQPDCEVSFISDVDQRAMDKCISKMEEEQGRRPQAARDFRSALDSKQVDVLVIAAPDHWHAPAAILACKAGKHVYVEKPCSHNPREGELLVAAARKYRRQVQMGAQRRSWPNIIDAIQQVKNGVIGRPYFAKGWYTNNRPSIGIGKKTEVPSWLDFDLWQGPAPRRPYQDNILHYNWHWFWDWGTGEALNNGTHMVDLMRWALNVDYPTSVSSAGGRYRYQDDWETPDTQVITWEFPNKTFMEWQGRSCNGRHVEGASVGASIYGENGTMELEVAGGNSYRLYDLNNNLLKEVKNTTRVDARNVVNPSSALDTLHIQNFFDGIKKGTPLTAEILTGHKSTLLCQLGNIAVRAGGVSLQTDPKYGHIIGNDEAQKYWGREYAPGWEPRI